MANRSGCSGNGVCVKIVIINDVERNSLSDVCGRWASNRDRRAAGNRRTGTART